MRVTVVVVIPVGPACALDHVRDTLESVEHYVTRSRLVLVLDDSGKGTGAAAAEGLRDAVALTTPGSTGKGAGLYLTLSRGFAYAHERHRFDVLLRLDTDALVIGANPEAGAVERFRREPGVGILGSYRMDCNGDPRDFSGARARLARETGLRFLLRDPRRLQGWRFLRRTLRRSRRNGYETGEHCMGGAYFMSRRCVAALHEHGFLSRREIAWSGLQEDQIFGLLAHAAGFRHGDLATGSLPMGLRWRGLPCAPEELVRRGKKVTHSTRFFGDMPEPAIRAYFRERRRRGSGPA